MLWFLLSEAVDALNDTRRRRFMDQREVLKSTPRIYSAANGDAALAEVLEFYVSLFHDAIAHMALNWKAYARNQKRDLRNLRNTSAADSTNWKQIMAPFSSTGPHLNDYRPVTVRPGIQVSRCILQALEREPIDAARMNIMTLAVARVISGGD